MLHGGVIIELQMGDGEMKRSVCSLGNDRKILSRYYLCAIFMTLNY